MTKSGGWENELIQPVSSSIVLDQKNMLYILAQDNLKVIKLLDDLYKDVSENSNQIVFFPDFVIAYPKILRQRV